MLRLVVAIATLGLMFGVPALGHSQSGGPAVGLLSRRALAFNPSSHKLYAVDSRNGEVIVIKKDRSRIKVKVGLSPVAVAVNTAANRIYVANNGSGSVSVIDGSSDTVVAMLDVGSHPYVLAASEASNKVYVSNTFSNKVSVIDGATNSIHTLNMGSADEIRVDPEKDEVYFLGYESDHLTVLDGKSETTHKVPAGTLHLWDMALDAASNGAYVTRIGRDDVALVDRAGHTPLAVSTGKMPGALSIDSRRHLICVANYADDSVSLVDALTHSVVATLPVGEHPQALAVDGDAGLVYVANTHSDSITVIDEVQRKVVATFPAGKNPYALAIDAEDGLVYAANMGPEPVTAIDVSGLRVGRTRK